MLFQIGHLKVSLFQGLTIVGVGVLLLVVLKLSHMYWSRKLARWAESQQLQIVSFRGARFYEGPSAWMRSRNQHLFRVVTQDRIGQVRSCWIMFGTYWGFNWGEPLKEVIWDDEHARTYSRNRNQVN